MTRHVVLVGLMGSGKTTVGKLLAERMQRPLVDTDAAVEAATGRTVREIWLAEGEPAYRVLENGVVVDALAAAEPSIIAAAGGVVLSPDNRHALADADALVVWLSADPDVLVGRAVTGAHRPLLDDDPHGALRKMATDRADLYAEVADVVVDVTDRRPEAIADEIVALVGRETTSGTNP
ncbi:shikimate kinase [Desertimonas flava]|uniref:shikimate kinase n=1 Tax=Desertimonas flava TaxID=2064846 RepID=UPI0019698FCC|nr:shikimate kinase [Desertimonas flava]